MISKQAKYALRALIGLARAEPGRAVLTADLAAQQRIPKKFLEQILLLLTRSGLVASRRGALGGSVPSMPPQALRLVEVLRLVDGPIAPLPCLSLTAYRRCVDCPDEASCEMRQAFQKVTEAMRRVLEETTIADALAAGDADKGNRLR